MNRPLALGGTLIVGICLASRMLGAECVPIYKPPVAVKGVICGTAVDTIRQPLGGADVTLMEAGQSGKSVATVHTDANGNFAFPNVPEGRYRFSLTGFNTPIGSVHVTGRATQCGQVVTVMFVAGGENCGSQVLLEGTLRLAANVGLAKVTIDDDSPVGIEFDRPFEDIDLEEGNHHIVVSAPGYRAVEFDVKIRNRRTTTHRVTLVRSSR